MSVTRSWRDHLARLPFRGGAGPFPAPPLGVAALVGVSGLVGVAAAVVVVLVVLPAVTRPTAADATVSLTRAVRVTTTMPPPPPLVVHVAGAVARPGLVQVPDGARVADAIAAAGGVLPDADDSRLNLAARLTDGSRLHVATMGEPDPPPALTGGGAAGSVGGSAAAGAQAAPVDLNTADEQALDALPGIGPATAAAIVAHRARNGPFASVDALTEVRGIGPAKLEALRPLVRV